MLDEAWIFLDHPLFAARIREWLKTLRKKNVAVVFATQSLADIAGSTIAPAIIESCPQRILLPNDRAIEPQSEAIYQRFGLNDRQIELIARAIPKRHYYLQSARGNRLFELGLGPIALALFAHAGIPADHVARAAEHEQRLLADRPVSVTILSDRPLLDLVRAEAATWLDRAMVADDAPACRRAGFGADLNDALARRRQWLLAHDLAETTAGGVRVRAGVIQQLQRRELLRVAKKLESETGKRFVEALEGERFEGVLHRRVDLLSGRFAMVERARDFTLVPWHPGLDRRVGRPVGGVIRGDGGWSIGRQRTGPTVE